MSPRTMGGRGLCRCPQTNLFSPAPRAYFSSSPSPASAPADLLYQPPNTIRPPTKRTSSAYLHRIHNLLYPPPPSEIAALAHRIPRLPKDILAHPGLLKSVEQCLVSPSFWKSIEEGDVRLEDLKKAVSKWEPRSSEPTSDFEEPGTDASSEQLFLPGKLTKVVAPDQSMDGSPHMHPFGSERRKILREQGKTLDPKLERLALERDWEKNYPKFTNYLDEARLHNDELATLGNSLLGMLGAEWINHKYPHLPTKAFQAALSMYVGPRTCADISRLWGVCSAAGLSNLTLEQKAKLERPGAKFAGGAFDLDGLPKNKGLAHKQDGSKGEERAQPGLLRWRRVEAGPNEEPSAYKKGILYEDAMANVSRAMVGLVYNLSGLGPAREFVRANWLSRKAQVGDLLKFTNPLLVLIHTLEKYGREPPVARLLRESGRASATAMYVVGSYSGSMKLGEAYGTSMKMAEYRAHEDALRRIYLSSSPGDTHFPSDTLVEPPGFTYIPPAALGDLEVEESSAVNRSGRRVELDGAQVLGSRRSASLAANSSPPVGSTMRLSRA